MPKDDSFYEDHTNRLWASWERASALNFYDSEEEAEHEQFLQERREQELREQWARWEQEQERVRRLRLLHPPKPPPSFDDEDDITFEELEDAVTKLDSTGAVNWSSLNAKTREHVSYYDVFFEADKEDGYETEEQQTGTSRQQPADREFRTEGSSVGGGARCPPTSARQIATFCSGSAAQPSNGAAQSPGMAVQPAQTEIGFFHEAWPTTTSARPTTGAS